MLHSNHLDIWSLTNGFNCYPDVSFTLNMNCSKMPEAIAGGSHPPDPMIMTELPAISLESMTPPSWTSDMESLIRNCYNYFGSERLLHEDTYSPAQPKAPTSTLPLSFLPCELVINERKSWDDVSNKVTTTHWESSAGCNNQDLSGCASFMEIYICYHCERQFTNKDAMRIHQNACSHRPDNQPGMQTPPPPPLPPPPSSRSSSSSKTLPIRGGDRARPLTTHHPTDDDRHNRVSKESFLKSFQLVQILKAEKLKSEKLKSRRNTDVDCQIIDVEPHDSVQQTSPRTPKSLISQLSREGEPGVHRKRLCYPTSIGECDGDSGDCVTNNNMEDIEAFKKSSKTNSLLCIDISSLLGLRIQKHVKAETTLQALPDIEQFCKTPEKNDALERLRTRPIMYPITFRNSKKTNTKFSHEYKFTRAQQKEFMKRVQTGLNKQSRMLKRTLKSCSVRLRRLNVEEIKKWTTPKRDARVNIQPLTHDQILLWTSNNKREYLKDSQNISSLYPWSPQKFPSKSVPTNNNNKSAAPMRRLGYHYYKMGSPVHKKVRKPPHPMTIYKSVYSNNSTSKAKPLAESRQFIPSVKHAMNDTHPFMRHAPELPRYLNSRVVPKPDHIPPHFANPYSALNPELLSSHLPPHPPLPHQAYRNLPNPALTPQFLVRHMENRSTMSPPPLVVIPVLGPAPDHQAIPGLGMPTSHGLAPHGILPSQEEPLKLVNKQQAPSSGESSNVHNKHCDDNVSIHTISSDSEDEDTYVTRCTICKRGPCECPPTECYRFLPYLQPKPAHQQQQFHTFDPLTRISDQNVAIAANNNNNNLISNKTIIDSPLRVIVNYNKYNGNNNNNNNNNGGGGGGLPTNNHNLNNSHHSGSSNSLASSAGELADGSRCLSSPGEQQISPKHVYAPIIKSVGHREKQLLKQYHVARGSPENCKSTPLKVINRVEAARGSKLFNEEIVENHAGSSVSHNNYYSTPQRTKSWHNAYNNNTTTTTTSNKIRAQKVGQSPNPSDIEDDDVQILEEVICID